MCDTSPPWIALSALTAASTSSESCWTKASGAIAAARSVGLTSAAASASIAIACRLSIEAILSSLGARAGTTPQARFGFTSLAGRRIVGLFVVGRVAVVDQAAPARQVGVANQRVAVERDALEQLLGREQRRPFVDHLERDRGVAAGDRRCHAGHEQAGYGQAHAEQVHAGRRRFGRGGTRGPHGGGEDGRLHGCGDSLLVALEGFVRGCGPERGDAAARQG